MNKPCGCGESNYSFFTSQKSATLRINVCRKCSHKWLENQKEDKKFNRTNDEDEY